jgi:hypothetical protein
MSKADLWDQLNLNVSSIQVFFNKEKVNAPGKFAPLTVRVIVQAQAQSGVTRNVTETYQPGAAQSDPATPRQIYRALAVIHPNLAAAFKSVALEAIDEDPSA